ncbi:MULTISPECIES: molybdopterin-synthase adenylyltransferase MoeB [Emticicia]|uniref:molybdopterin-synthase adenylyltransferase MoeB n=1 Tax=Emticicia TaxID=312278 RepID=UPI0007D8C0A4|nr:MULTISPECIES: molybdopterin-synthase adenylyltransferase MoeB [Emticicia]
MLIPEEFKRYNRQMLMPEFGEEGQIKLKNSKVLVIGCGGLGSPILLYLAAAGIGTLGLVENDTIDESNLQRQILYSTSSVGQSKIEQAANRLHALNPLVDIELHQTRLTTQNALEIFSNYDLIIDGTDNFPTRYLVNDACVLLNKPFVYGAIHRFEGQVAVFNYKNSVTYRDLFPSPPPPEQAPNCAEAGVLGVLPGIIGSMQALEAIKVITEIGETLAGKLFILDTLSMQSRIIKISKSPETPKITQLIDYESFCGLKSANEISFEELKFLDNYQLIDVREMHEYKARNIGGELMPLSELEKHITNISREKTVIIHCQSGIRSKKAIKILEETYGFNNLLNLTGGINAI